MHSFRIIVLSVVLAGVVQAQTSNRGDGFEVGSFTLQPGVELQGAYDDRTIIDANGKTGDFYSELDSTLKLNNGDAVIGISGEGRYGYRFYADESGLNDDFYSSLLSVSSGRDRLNVSGSVRLAKSLSYNTAVDASSATGPSGILTDETSKNFTSSATVSFTQALSERTALTPSLTALHYLQDFETRGDVEWQTYSAGLEMAFAYTERTFFTCSADHALVFNEEEDGMESSLSIGSRRQATEKIRWDAEIGISFVDYETSGKDQGLLSSLRLVWQATDKFATYAFGGQSFEPGYGGGGARELYRAGYGVNWQLTSRWSVSGSGLHNYESAIGGGTGYAGGVEHFYSLSTSHALGERAEIGGGVNFANDKYEEDQMVFFLRLSASL